MEEQDYKLIDASPTKEFFIGMIVRDISLKMAILDLVDNSVDSAYDKAGSTDLSKFEIKISCLKDKFIIEDNCAGFDEDTARNYVFRFGSDNKIHQLKSSIGQFGIGLKRTIFKMGNKFKVESKTESSSLIIEDDIKDWSTRKRDIFIDGNLEKEDDWHFILSEQHHTEIADTGTKITITELYENIKNSFLSQLFINKLISEIAISHMVSLNNGIKIQIVYYDEKTNTDITIDLEPQKLTLIKNEKIKPLVRTITINTSKGEKVNANIQLGIIKRDFNKSGIYIFCNNRTILHANKDSLMWNKEVIGRNWHHNYALFCAYIFLESEDTSALPWTTTKEGVDQDSEVFQKLSSILNIITRDILDFLRKAASERDKKTKNEYLNSPIYSFIDESEESLFIKSNDITVNENFSSNIEEAVSNENYNEPKRIQYDKPKDEIEKLKKIFGVENNYEVGIETFNRVYKKLVLGK